MSKAGHSQCSEVQPQPSSQVFSAGRLLARRPPRRATALLAALRTMLAGLGVLAVLSHPLHAHDAFECWTSAIVRADRLELAITMASGTALRLIDPEAKVRGLSEQNFPTLRARLEKEAAALCVLTSNRKPLVVRKVEVELTEENDVAFKVVYPRPAAGPLHFHAAFLKKLGEGYGGILEATDTSGNHLGWEQLSFENPNYEVTVLPPGPAKKS